MKYLIDNSQEIEVSYLKFARYSYFLKLVPKGRGYLVAKHLCMGSMHIDKRV